VTGPARREIEGRAVKKPKKLAYVLATPVVLYVLAVVISNSLSGCAGDPRPLGARSSQASPNLRLMTFNAHYESAPEASADAITKVDADVICLQESTKAWEEYARTQLGQRYPHAIFHHETYAGGSAILSRYPMTELLYEMPPMSWFHGLGVKIKTDIGDVKLLNIHLRPGASGQGGLTYLNYFRLPKIHPQEVDHLYKRMSGLGGDAPLIVMGDFNESDDGKAIQYLTERGFTRALAAFDPDSSTWHGRVLGIALAARCDHILYSSQFRCLDAAVLKEGASDHRPVVAVLTMGDAKPTTQP
jgi:endonuclease/exonuclease/phosphatase family metal-dependent hydrolase